MPDQINIKYCPLCGISVPFGEKFCPRCNYNLNDYHTALEKITSKKKFSSKNNQVNIKYCPLCGTSVSFDKKLCSKCEYNLNDYRTAIEKLTLNEKITPTISPPSDKHIEAEKISLKKKENSEVTTLLNNNTAIENAKLEKKLLSTIKSRIKIRFSKKTYMVVGTTTIFIAFFFLVNYIDDTSEPSKQAQLYTESITVQKEESSGQQELTKQEITSTSGQKEKAEKEENIIPLNENQTKKESVTVQDKKTTHQQEEQKQKLPSISKQKTKDEFLVQKEEAIAPFNEISPEEEIARQTFINYQQALVNGDYETAYDMLTSEQKRRVGTFNRYINSHSDMLDGIVTDIYTMKSSPESITIGYRLTVDDRMPDDRLRTQIFRGRVTLVERDGYWYIFNSSSRKAEEFIRRDL